MNAEQIQMRVLNKGMLIAEKIIAVVLVLWGMYSLFSEISFVAEMVSSGYAASTRTSYWNIAAVNHLAVILSIVSLFGGFLLFFNDKAGWMLSLIAAAMYSISFFISSRSNAANSDMPFASFYKSYGLTALLFIAILVVLLLKPYRQKYQPNVKTWLWMIGVLVLLLIDKAVF